MVLKEVGHIPGKLCLTLKIMGDTALLRVSYYVYILSSTFLFIGVYMVFIRNRVGHIPTHKVSKELRNLRFGVILAKTPELLGKKNDNAPTCGNPIANFFLFLLFCLFFCEVLWNMDEIMKELVIW